MRIDQAEFNRRGALPWDDDPMQGVDNYTELAAARWGSGWAGDQVMHLEARNAWDEVHPGVVPTFFQIEDDINGSGALVSEAARLRFERYGPQQTTPQLRRYEMLVYLFGTSRGSRIWQGSELDPNNGATLTARQDPGSGKWYVVVGVAPPAPPKPPAPPPVDPTPIPPTPPAKLPPRPGARILETARLAPGWTMIGPGRRARLGQLANYIELLDAYLAQANK